MPLWSRRTAIMMLTGLVLSALGVPSAHPASARTKAECAPAARTFATVPAVLVAHDSPPVLSTPFSPWKMRRKAVLEHTDTRIGLESDLGPACLPALLAAQAQDGPIHSCLINRIPLRC
jgi:hypothetical protein